ncbi:diguanylate cyclase [Ferrimonas sp.]|uniref:diguanylate cyclase n=1 Tax=Ferrimonas sp. TaxID=2080861 RepID=UPI003A911E5A
MFISIRRKILVPFSILILLIVFNYALSYTVQNRLENERLSLNRTSDVIAKSHLLLGHLRDAETGQRGYLLTLDPSYLEPYHRGVAESNRIAKALVDLVKESPKQKGMVDKIIQLKDEKFSELALTIDKAKAGDISSAIKIVQEDTGKDLMDNIRLELAVFKSIENKILREKSAAANSNWQLAKSMLLIQIVILVGAAIFTLVYTDERLVKPLIFMREKLKDFDLEAGVKEFSINQNDEIGSLAKVLNKLFQRLKLRSEELDQVVRELEIERDKALNASTTDPLTGLANRRKFEEVGNNELRRAHREDSVVNLIMIDVDYFKSINDLYGHTFGDQVLKDIASCLSSQARRPNDAVFRVGGEEFVFLASGLDAEMACSFAKSLRLSVEMLGIENEGSDISDVVTMSAGVVTIKPSAKHDIYSLLQSADRLLYQAKNSGRNCVMCAPMVDFRAKESE